MLVTCLQTPVALTFHDGERLVGADALTLQARKPEYTFVVRATLAALSLLEFTPP